MFQRYGPLALLLIANATVTTVADSPALTPQAGVLVLRNGGIHVGRITRLGDRYAVTFGQRGEIYIPREEVDFQCESLERAYQIKREALPKEAAVAGEHLRLAQWCLRHGLLARAADQLLSAEAADPAVVKISVLRSQLRLAELDRINAAREPIEESTRVAHLAAKHAENLSRKMPTEIVEQFTIRVQPILINRCGNAACHGVRGKSDFQLIRSPHGIAMSRKLTHRNLQAALRYIDRDTPEKSLLLTAPSAAHGGAQSAVFSSRDRRQVEQLQQWAGKVARLLDDAPTTIARPDAVLLQPSQQSNLPWMRSLEATRLTGKEAGQGKASSVWKEENLGWEQERPSGKGIFKPPFVPRDPFDAEIFNRRYGLTDIKQHETQARTNTTPAVQDSSRFRSSKSQGILPPPRPKSFPIAPDGGAKTGP